MRIARNKFLVEVDEQFVTPKIKGLEFIDSDYHPKLLATKIGRIHSLPITLSSEYRNDLKLDVGDTIVFNHLVCQQKNKFSQNIFFCQYYNIYGRITGDVFEPVEDIFFLNKIVEPDIDLGAIKIPGKISSKCAKVFAVSKYAESQGIKIGDIIYFTKDADYEISFAGISFYRMYLRNVIGIERDGELVTFRNKLLVKDVTELGHIGGLDKIYANNSLRTGIVYNGGTTGIPIGSKVTYFNGVASVLNWKGIDYSFITEENLKYIL